MSNVRTAAGENCMTSLSRHNSPLIMSQCGSKGSPVNIAQMVACVGQQVTYHAFGALFTSIVTMYRTQQALPLPVRHGIDLLPDICLSPLFDRVHLLAIHFRMKATSARSGTARL